jgi:exoribonuclease II
MSNISSSWNTLFNNSFNNIHKNNHSDFNQNNQNDFKLDDLYGLENKRIDYKHLKIYSIDPPKCTDADDAFSIYKDEDNNIHLMIHIADPTSYFNPNDKLFEDIINNGCTVYLSNREPDHLFPNNILEKSSLNVPLNDGIRNVVIVHTILKPIYNPSNMFDIIKTTIEYGIIDCNNGKSFTYDEAAKNMYNDITLYLGVDIAKFFYSQRQNNNNSFIFSNLIFTVPKVIDNEVVLKSDSKEVTIMKAMIGEFAIHANTIFANGLDDENLFLRTLSLPSNLNNISNNNLIHDLIKEGISANYQSEKLKHDLIGCYYTHSTSPLRRASDCIVHFLLKAKYLQIESPFNEEQLKIFAERLNSINKEMKNIQFKDIKLRTFQWIAEELECRLNSIKIKVKVINFKAPFVNLMIISIDNMDVNIPYTIKRKQLKTKEEYFNVNITKINYYNKYDEGTLPEIDELL